MPSKSKTTIMSPIATMLSSSFIVALIGTALTAPAPQAAPVLPPTRSSQCASKPATIHIEWGIYVVNTTMPSDKGSGSWGGGLLDNINGKSACAPTSWQAQVDSANPQGVGATFNTPLGCSVNDISNAIHAASTESNQNTFGPGQWVYCEGDTLNYLFDGLGKVIQGISQDVGAVAGLLGSFAK